MIIVKVKNNGDKKIEFEKAFRRFKRKVETEGIMRELKKRRYFMSKSKRKKEKRKLAEKRRRKIKNKGQ